MARQITWALATKRGVAYNPKFKFNEIQLYLNFLSRYWDIVFVRQTDYASARIKFLNTNAASVMETNIGARECYISSYFNFANNSYWSCRALTHEFMHMAGGPNHLGQPNIMAANGGSAGNFTQADCNYMRAYGWRSAVRPWQEPNAMKTAFTAVKAFYGVDMEEPVLPENPTCKCKQGLLCSVQKMFTKEPWV
jgi:hypothetical protein